MKMPKNEDVNLQKKFDNQNKKKGKNKKNYIALGACILAVSAISWSAYKSINTFISPFKNSSAKKSDKVSKNLNSDSDKKTILSEDGSEQNSKNGKTIPYGKVQETKSENIEKNAEKAQPVSASPSNCQINSPAEDNNILKEFSNGNLTYSATMGDWRTHEGTDFKMEVGSNVKSVSDGVVKDVYNDPRYGNTVVIEHIPGFIAYYSGLDENNLIEKGKKVQSGENIGTIGKIPCEIADPTHLHFSIFKDSKFIDPMIILDKEPH